MKKMVFLLILAFQQLFPQAQGSGVPVYHYYFQFTTSTTNLVYTAGDLVSGSTGNGIYVIPFSGKSKFFSGEIVAARLEHDTANTANGTFRLFFYADSVDFGTRVNNAAFTPVFGNDFDSLQIGYINFTLQSAGTASSQIVQHYLVVDPPVQFSLPAAKGSQRSLWAVLVATGAYAPDYNGGHFGVDVWIRPH